MSTIRQNTGSEYGPQMYADEWRQRRWIFRRRWSNVLFMLLIHRHTPEINWFSFIHFIITQSHTVRSQTPVVYTVIKHRPQPERCSAENCGMELYSPNRNYSRKTKKIFFKSYLCEEVPVLLDRYVCKQPRCDAFLASASRQVQRQQIWQVQQKFTTAFSDILRSLWKYSQSFQHSAVLHMDWI